MATNDAFDFSRFFGGNMGFGMPGIVTPTLDIDELDKKIKDLKAVEGWLSMNLSMLQMSIQGLEVQRNTLSSLKAMGEAFNQSMSDVSQAAKDNANIHTTKQQEPVEEKPVETPTEPSATNMWPWDFAAQAMASLQQQMHDSAQKADDAKEQVATPGTAEVSEVPEPQKKPTRPRKPKSRSES